ncbi:MAG: hypothetical protein QG604_380 [Candidatus Dependentiae bacterium]|nr:hypothetical protein [Candidatus Dependentiae bacterium]
MYVQVRLLKGYAQPLLYEVPAHLMTLITLGSVVEVPLRKQQVAALVVEVLRVRPTVSYDIRSLTAVHQFPQDPHFLPYVEKLAQLYFVDAAQLCGRLRSFTFFEEGEEAEDDVVAAPYVSTVALTAAQQAVVEQVRGDLIGNCYKPTLLQGVTGSGKTEVYKALMVEAIGQGKAVIFLCPEVSLARQMQATFDACFDRSISVAGWHSAITGTERQEVWQSAVRGNPMILVGVHLPVLLPLTNLGLIIIDEEHDGGYEEKQYPRINSKHAALLRAKQYGVPIILGSATPSVTTLYHARQQQWRHCVLTERFGGAFPQIEHVLLSKEKKRPNFWVSKELLSGLADTVFRGKQAIVYLNRRGYGFFLQCVGCGYTFECSSCAVSMTVHHDEHAGGVERMLECHYCNARRPMPPSCTACGMSTDEGKCKGIGTQQMVSILAKLLPGVRIARADADISRRKKAWKETIDAFAAGEIDILVGTQIITKGFHFPNVILVGVVWADSAVHFPVYNAHEVALQQLIQVAGRAGRACTNGRVIVQSFDNHPVFSFISELTYPQFCEQELEARREWGYPPFGRLVTIEISHENEEQVVADASVVKQRIADRVGPLVQVLGPARPLRAKVQGVHYRQVLCKADNYKVVHEALSRTSWNDIVSAVVVNPS